MSETDTHKADTLAALASRERELCHERDLIDARLSEVRELLAILETPTRARKPRVARNIVREVEHVQPMLEDQPA